MAGGQRGEAAGLHGRGGQQRCVVGAFTRRGGQLVDPGDVAGEHGRGGCLDEQSGAFGAVRCEVGGPLQGLRRGRVATASTGPARGLLQRRRDARVRAGSRGRAVPGAPVRCVAEQVGQGEVGGAPGVGGSGVVDGGPHEGVGEVGGPAGASDQSSLQRGAPRGVFGAGQPGRRESRRVGRVHGRKEEQQLAGGGREFGQAGGEDPLQFPGEWQRSGRAAAG